MPVVSKTATASGPRCANSRPAKAGAQPHQFKTDLHVMGRDTLESHHSASCVADGGGVPIDWLSEACRSAAWVAWIIRGCRILAFPTIRFLGLAAQIFGTDREFVREFAS